MFGRRSMVTGVLALTLASAAHLRATRAGTAPPLGLDLYMPVPDENPTTPEKVALGERLFFDVRLSVDGSRSCASCHQPARAFTDGRRSGRGVSGRPTKRNVPSILNAGYSRSFFWDGRSSTLEDQVLMPITSRAEMGATLAQVTRRLAADAGYRERFHAAFGEDPSATTVARALAAFVRSRRSGESAFDRHVAGDPSALTADARAGLRLFQGQARCVECHFGPLLADGRLHNTGVGWGGPDRGRAAVTRKGADRGTFKTPSLRNVALTAPYMHDGSLATLEDVVDFYARGGKANPNLDPAIRRLELSIGEKRQLVAYLRALTSAEYARQAQLATEQQIYIMATDGTALRRLTDSEVASGGPAYRVIPMPTITVKLDKKRADRNRGRPH